MTHLTSDELIDAMEAEAGQSKSPGVLEAERMTHLSSCPACQAQLTELAAVLNDAKESGVVEPSPLFWNHFSQRVSAAIDAEPAGLAPWLRWQVLVPLGAVAMLIVALVVSVPQREQPAGQEQEAIVSAASSEQPSDEWGVFAELVGELDLETASAAGVIEPGAADLAVLHLTAEERQELTRLLQAELTRVKS